MLLLAHPSSDRELPPEPRRRARGGIVWRAHTEGFATIAYRDGHAIAGISGPWSQQYVLIWWQPSQPIREVEVFDSLEAAMQAVVFGSGADGSHLDALLARLRGESQPARSGWLDRVSGWFARSSRRVGTSAAARRHVAGEDTDLRGLSFRAIR